MNYINHTPRYPDFDCSFVTTRDYYSDDPNLHIDVCVCKTIVRRKHRGKWYLQLFVTRRIQPAGKRTEAQLKEETIKEFISQIYIVSALGKVIPKQKCSMGLETYPLDPDQRSEEDRFKAAGLIP